MDNLTKNRSGLPVLGTVNIVGGVVIAAMASDSPNAAAATFTVLVAVVSVVMGIGLIKGKRWAWRLAIGGYALNVLVVLASANVIAVIVAAAILAYLNSAPVKAIFAAVPKKLAAVPSEPAPIASATSGVA